MDATSFPPRGKSDGPSTSSLAYLVNWTPPRFVCPLRKWLRPIHNDMLRGVTCAKGAFE